MKTFKPLEQVKCSLCGLDNTKLLFPLNSTRLVRCRECGLVYINPRHIKEEEKKFYTFRCYESENIRIWRDAKIKLFEKALEKIKVYKDRGKLLDIGCGMGYFLKIAQQKGWQTFGVELSKKAGSFAKEKLGLNIFQGEVIEAGFESGSFDVITLWNVLDHLHDPVRELIEIGRILKRGGLIYLRLPNISFSLMIYRLYKILKMRRLKDYSVFHLYGFSAKTIKLMLEKTNFDVIELVNAKPSLGDPYKISGLLPEKYATLIKEILFNLNQFIFYLTGRKCILASSIEVYAGKQDV